MPLALWIAIKHHRHRLLQPGQIVADQNRCKPEQKKLVSNQTIACRFRSIRLLDTL